jgi:GNAT superfamily N-acetyltransferase
MQISHLRHVPQFADTIAHRGWNAFDSGLDLANYRAGLDPMMEADGVPFALVVHHNEVYLGSTLVIGNDLAARPNLTPWIAALWVEPSHRSKGIAAALITEARAALAKTGIMRCYLCATPANSPYYLARGFTLIEDNVTGLNVFDISTKI